jgi:hypothetical protein
MRIDPLPKISHCAKVAILSGLVLLSVVPSLLCGIPWHRR